MDEAESASLERIKHHIEAIKAEVPEILANAEMALAEIDALKGGKTVHKKYSGLRRHRNRSAMAV
jgi:hypothetical protein